MDYGGFFSVPRIPAVVDEDCLYFAGLRMGADFFGAASLYCRIGTAGHIYAVQGGRAFDGGFDTGA